MKGRMCVVKLGFFRCLDWPIIDLLIVMSNDAIIGQLL